MAESARITAVRPLEADYPDHVRVLVQCACSGLTDLTWSADVPPVTVGCAGCGAELELPEALRALTPGQARRAAFRASLRDGTGAEDG